jgi:hypothetical protein
MAKPGKPCYMSVLGLTEKTIKLVNEYNTMQLQLAPIQNPESQLQGLDSKVTAVARELDRRQHLLTQTRKDDECLQKRIHRNEHPRFLHFFVCKRKAKVERLKEEYAQLTAVEQDLSRKVDADSALLSNLQQQQQNAQAVIDRKHQLELHCRNLFEQIVNEQPATPCLQQLQNNVQQQRGALSSSQQALQNISNSGHLIQQGLAFFQQAESIYQLALQVNQKAVRVNRAEAAEIRRERVDLACGAYFSAEFDERNVQRLECHERHLQRDRDALINQANGVAMQGYQAISAGFSAFDLGSPLRQRYPDLCQPIGHIALPRIEGANFSQALKADRIFGTAGAAFNDYRSGCKIEHNMRVVQQCASITSSNLSNVNAVLSSAAADVQCLQTNLQNLEQKIAAERVAIFNAALTSVARTSVAGLAAPAPAA